MFSYENARKSYKEAISRVIFEGATYVDLQPSTTWNYWEINGKKIIEESNIGYCFRFSSLEDLTKFNLQLTESAAKLLGL